MAQNALIRQRVAELQAQAKIDREWWDKKKASIQSEFMKELDADSAKLKPIAAAGDKFGSDEDAVLVEGGGPASTGSVAGTKGGTKKRKGKK